MAILSIVSTQDLHIGVFLVENQLANWINFAAVPDLATGEQTSLSFDLVLEIISMDECDVSVAHVPVVDTVVMLTAESGVCCRFMH